MEGNVVAADSQGGHRLGVSESIGDSISTSQHGRRFLKSQNQMFDPPYPPYDPTDPKSYVQHQSLLSSMVLTLVFHLASREPWHIPSIPLPFNLQTPAVLKHLSEDGP